VKAPSEGNAPVHRQFPHLFTHIDYSLTPEGILEEEVTSQVLTHSKVLPYGEVWDGYFDRTIPWGWWFFPCIMGIAAACLLLSGLSVWGAACAVGAFAASAGILAFGWRCTYTAFDYEGHWVVTFEDRARDSFQRFLDAFQEKVQGQRFSLQKHLEGLPLGEVDVKGRWGRWSCRFRYDRITVERSGPWKKKRERYYSLAMLHAPVRLVWKPSWAGLGALVAVGIGCGLIAWRVPAFQGYIWLWCGAGMVAGSALPFALGRVAVSAPAGDGSLESPAFPFFRREELRRILLWFSRLANLSDSLEELHSEDYWEYHREKVTILRELGFLEEWPFRSALGKINSQARENLVPEP
jgi:hypothetical protein